MVMRTGSSDIQFHGQRGRIRPDARSRKARKARYCFVDLEGLESRMLLATIPAAAPATVDGTAATPINLTSYTQATASTGGNTNSPTVAINPYDSQEVVAVWGVDIHQLVPTPQTTEILQGAFSLNGGATWNSMNSFRGFDGDVLPDPALYTPTAPTPPYLQVTGASLGFDSEGNFYVLDTEHNGTAPSPTSGAIVLNKYSFVGGTEVVTDFSDEIIDQWVNGPSDLSAVIAVDAGTYPNSGPGTTPPAGSGLPNDPNANKVYIAWATNDINNADPIAFPPSLFSPNRALLLVSSDGGITFSGETYPDPVYNSNVKSPSGIQLNTHPQLVINSNNDGQVVVGWEDIGGDEGTTNTKLKTGSVTPGESYSSTPTNTTTGPIASPIVTTDPRGNWATAVYGASGDNNVDPTDVVANQPVTTGGKTNDIVVSNEGANSSPSGIGVLLNQGTGTYPNPATPYNATGSPSSETVGDFILNPVPPPATMVTVDDALANDNSQGGVIIVPSDGAGNFGATSPITVNTAPFTIAVASGAFNVSGDSIIAVNQGANHASPSIDVLPHDNVENLIAVPIPPNMTDPTAVVVGDFSGNPNAPDFAVLSGEAGSPDNFVTVFQNTTLPGGALTFSFETPFDLGRGGAVGMTTGNLTGNAIYSDLAIVFNTANANDLDVLQNTTTASFNIIPVANSVFPGTAVGVATGTLSTGGTYTTFQDIAVLYTATGSAGIPAGESMVRVFQNKAVNNQFLVTPNPVTGGDYDAGATFTGNVTTGSTQVLNISSTQGLFSNELVNGAGIPAGTTINVTQTPFTGTLTTGSAAVTAVSSTAGLFVGETVTGTGVLNGTTILAINAATATITLSTNATVTGPQSLIGVAVTLSQPATVTGTPTMTASETNPTSIAVSNLSGAGGSWNSIVVTNDDFGGTVSVLAPVARPVPTPAPSTSTFDVTVNIPNPAAITDLTVFLEVVDTALADLKIVLEAPDGASIILITNQYILVGTTATQTSANVGIPGTSMGVFDYSPGPPTIPGFPVGTIFDDTATRDIVDLNPVGDYGAPTPPITAGRGAETDYIGHWRPENTIDPFAPDPFETLAKFVAAAQGPEFNGTWKLEITDQIPKDFGFVEAYHLDFSTGQATGPSGQIAPPAGAPDFPYTYTSADGTVTDLTGIVIPGALGNIYSTSLPAVPNGLPDSGAGPGMVMAIDDTLGDYSTYQGRIYIAFVGYFNVSNPRTIVNPTTNTDIFLEYSDDGGQTWSTPELVNDDQGITDGYSGANDSVGASGDNQITGRSQFQPEIAVDQATGTVVVSYRSAQNDTANARVATYIATSINGGVTFGPETYANPEETAVDAITGQTEVIGPDSDNQAGGNPQTDSPFGYGTQMGLAVFDGQLFPVWAGNFWGPNAAPNMESTQDPLNNGNLDSFVNSSGAVIGFPLNVWYQPMVIASGPRIVSSTMGPVVDASLSGSAVDVPQFIPPPSNDIGTTTSTLAITGDPSLNVASLEVTLSLIYPTDGNLTLTLISPPNPNNDNKTTSVILYQNPNDKGQDFTDTTFSDSATESITNAAAPYTGTFIPLQSLSAFNGLQAFGNWKLQITGGIGPNGGILQSWSLAINGIASMPTSFEVTFDRPIDPKALLNLGEGTFTPADVTVLYHDTNPNTAADPPIPLLVTNVVPVQANPADDDDPTQNGTDGYTQWIIYFDPTKNADGSASGITDFTGTYSYVIAPDNTAGGGNGTAISSPIGSWRETPVAQPVISEASVASQSNLSIPTWGPGGSDTEFDITQSTINLAGFNDQIISGLTVNLNITDPLNPPGLGSDGDLLIELTAPNGNTAILYYKPGDTSENFNNVTFSDAAAQSILLANGPYDNGTFQPFNPLTGFNGSAVNGAYTLTIDNFASINSGTLLSWSITVNSTKLKLEYHTSTAMDQNADGTSDENPLTTPFTGLAPGDAYVVPTPQPTAPFTFNASNILSLTPPFDENTLPLIMPGPYVMSTSVPNGTGTDNLVLNGTNSSFNLTFDTPMEVSSFASDGDQVLQIMGPVGSISDPQTFPSDGEGLMIPSATTTGPGVLLSTLTIPSYDGTFNIKDLTVQLSAAFQPDADLTADLIAPGGLVTGTLATGSATVTGLSSTNGLVVGENISGTGIPAGATILAINSATASLTLSAKATASGSQSLTAYIPLFSGVGGNKADFTNTVLDDSAETSITDPANMAPYTGTFQPTGLLSTLNGDTVDVQNAEGQWVAGVWQLKVINSSLAATGTLDSWALNITPVITVTPVNPVGGLASTFTVNFPQQELSGTYTIQIGPGITSDTFPVDAADDAVDSALDAGLDVLRGGSPTSPVTTVRYTAADTPKPITAPAAGASSSTVTSTIIVPDNFVVQGDTTSSGISGLRVTLSLTYPTDPNLMLSLEHFDVNGNLLGSIPLATSVGSGPTTANFNNTILDDNATTPIQNAAAPFFATYNPQMPLADFAGENAQGTWVLVVQNNSTTGGSGTINSWALSFQKPVPTSGLGVPGADNINVSFRIFTLGQADAMAAEAWTAVGPAAISSGPGATTVIGPSGSGESSNGGRSGRVTGVSVDTSDPTGNTVYAAGASGGVWKTTDFLTTSPAGPTWIPLTDFGPSNAINIGSITVFSRNDNVNDTIIIAATGEGNTGTPGVGFLISMDGGATWTLDDSSVNVDSSGNPLPIETTTPSLERNRTFVGDTSYQVVVDPKLSPSGQVIIYAAMSGPTGGIWRSENTGATWTNMLPGQATSVVLDQESGLVLNPDTDTTTQGNLQVVYAGIQGVGVELSPNQGQIWNLMTGGVGNPLIFNEYNAPPTNVNPGGSPTPNGAEGRITLAVPDATGNAAEDPIYEGWLYAAVANPAGGFFGLFITKDFGENWTDVSIPTLAAVGTGADAQAIPNDTVADPDYPITGGGQFTGQGNYDLILAVDPTNPNIAYLGGSADGGQTALIRVDATNIWDAHSLVPYSQFSNDGGLLSLSSTGPATITALKATPPVLLNEATLEEDPTYYEDLIRNPQDPFLVNATLDVFDYSSFTNNGTGVTWTVFDPGGTDYHAVTTMVDPLTGLPRLLFGNDQGVWTILDNDGTFETQIGTSASGVQLGSPTDQLASTDRNGNLQITQFYYGAAQPSTTAAENADALFYGSAQDDGGPVSDPNILTTGNLTGNGPGGDATGVGTDQQGSGSAYQFFWPCCGGDFTDFFQYIAPGLSGAGLGEAGELTDGYVSRTFGLLQASGGQPTPDPQWPFETGANFAVDPVNSADVIISSSVGRIFTTSNDGVTWFDVGDPPVFGSPGSFSLALAYGAPDPSAPEGVGNLGNFIYVGTSTGQIYVTQDGGGNGTSNDWINISAGLAAINSPIRAIITSPIRGSHEAYAVTTTGVYYMANSIASATNPTPTWINITSNINELAYSILGQPYNPTTDGNLATYNQAITLSSIIADWRYQIPINPANPSEGTYPVLYVGAGNSFRDGSGVFQSVNNGTSWTLFPSTTYGAVTQGGDLPHVPITDLDTSLGNIDTNTGMPVTAGPYETFVFVGTLTSGSDSVTGVNFVTGLAAGDDITGPGIPAGTTIASVDSSTYTITLSADATVSGAQNLAAADPSAAPDPDVLLATTYGRGQYAINLNPLILFNSANVALTVAPTTGTAAAPIVTGPITISGTSEISSFGNTTWITVEDVTDPADPKVIAGFNPANGVTMPLSSGAGANSTNTLGNFTIPFDPASYYMTNGAKTIEVFATDAAGSVGNVLTYTFTLNDGSLPQPPPASPPTVTLALSPGAIRATSSGTFSFTGTLTSGSASVTNLSTTTGLVAGQTVSGTGIPAGTTIEAVSSTNFTGTLVNQSASVTNVNSTTGLFVGETITGGIGIPSGTTIQAIDSATSITLSAPATVSNTQDLTAIAVTLSAPATASGISVPITVTSPITISVTNQTTPSFSGTVTPGASVEIYEYEQVTAGGPYDVLIASFAATVGANGSFNFLFSNPPPVINNGNFEVDAVAYYTKYPLLAATMSNIVYMQINNTTPATVTDFRLDPADDLGISGDDITSDHTPFFIGLVPGGAAVAGDTIELFSGTLSLQTYTGIVQGTTINDLNGQPYNFAIQAPAAFGDGTTSLEVIVIANVSGNASALSNPAPVTFVSIASDYNGDNYSDAALYDPSATSTGPWLVQTTSEVKPITFMGTLTPGSMTVTYAVGTPSLLIGQTITGTGLPAAGATILSMNPATNTVTLSASATVLAPVTETLTAAPPPIWFPSNTTFPNIAPTTFMGTLAIGSASVTALSSTTGLFIGQTITGTGIPAGTTILTINSSTSTITLSAKATVTGAQTLTAAPPDGVPFQGDFDGDGKADLAFYDLATATWYVDDSKQGLSSFQLGNSSSVPVVGYFNFNTNLPEELGIYNVVNGQGIWSINTGNTGIETVFFGGAGDIPVPGDYTGVGYDEVAVYRPSTGQFLVQVPGLNGTTTTQIIPLPAGTPDLSSLVPVPGNYDPHQISTSFMGTLTIGSELVTGLSSTTGLFTGQTVTGTGIPSGTMIQSIVNSTTILLSANSLSSGSQSLTASQWIENTEAAWFDPKTGEYTIDAYNGVRTVTFQANDIPVPADYMGSGSTQPAVFRPSTGQFIEQVNGQPTVIATFAQASGDIPLAAPLSYRMPDPPAAGSGGGSTGTGSGGGSTGTGSGGGSTGTGSGGGSTGTGSGGGSTGTGSGGGSTGTGGSGGSGGSGSTGTGTGSGSGSSTTPPPAQGPTTGKSTTGSHKHKKTVPHPAPKPHAKKPAKPVVKKTAPHAKHKPKVQIHVVSHTAHKVVNVSTASTSAQNHGHVVDLALQDIHVNLLRKNSHG
jgi:subtilisin-like proprotein convertase family protein